jgi:acetylornithine/N-succinyldiaminopimelate aminotransferase
MNLFDVYPLNNIAITKASGSTVWDATGQEYLDLYGGYAVISIGHTHPHYVARLTDQLSNVGFYSNSVLMPLQVQLAEELGQVSGKTDYQLFLHNTGAEANENAPKLASFYNNRKKVIAFKGSFHDRTSLAVAATDNPKIVAPVNDTDNVIFLPHNDETALARTFAAQGNRIAAVIIEGIQGIGGIREASVSFLKRSVRGAMSIMKSILPTAYSVATQERGLFYTHDYAGVNADV